MDPDEITAIYFVLALIFACPVSLIWGGKWATINPDKLPFKWGYFQGSCHIIGFASAAMALNSLVNDKNDALLKFICLHGFISGITGIFMLRRNRWWWIAGILFSLNPLYWIVNGIYLSNRWGEMREEVRAKKLARGKKYFPEIVYLQTGENESGPYHKDQVTKKWNASEITADVNYRGVEESEWKPLHAYFQSAKKPWSIWRIAKWGVLSLLCTFALWLIALIVASSYNEWHIYRANRPKIQKSFCGFELGNKRDDVLFFHGKPVSNESNFMSQTRWLYEDVNYSKEKSLTVIEFENERIYTITYASDKSDYDTPEIMGFKQGSNYEEIIKKLGNPSLITTSKDGLERMLYYDNWNAYFVLEKAQVTFYGIYDSTKARPELKW
jgi:hypothetical protein